MANSLNGRSIQPALALALTQAAAAHGRSGGCPMSYFGTSAEAASQSKVRTSQLKAGCCRPDSAGERRRRLQADVRPRGSRQTASLKKPCVLTYGEAVA